MRPGEGLAGDRNLGGIIVEATTEAMSMADGSGRGGVEIQGKRVWAQLWGIRREEGSERKRQRSRRKTHRARCQQRQRRVPVREGKTAHRHQTRPDENAGLPAGFPAWGHCALWGPPADTDHMEWKDGGRSHTRGSGAVQGRRAVLGGAVGGGSLQGPLFCIPSLLRRHLLPQAIPGH